MESTNRNTVEEWFHTVQDEDIKKKLFKNTEQHRLLNKEINLKEAIYSAFIFNESPEGDDYWYDTIEYLTK